MVVQTKIYRLKPCKIISLLLTGTVLTSCVAQSPTSADDQSVESASQVDATIQYDSDGCRNEGVVEAFGQRYELIDPLPLSWRDTISKSGVFVRVDDTNGVFESGGHSVSVTLEGHEDLCIPWQEQ